jgi:agmatine deiminase
MPAEWEVQASIWLALPHDQEEWGTFYQEARASVIDLANTLVQTQRVDVLIPDEASAAMLDPRIVCHKVPYGDIWLRDTGPIFVAREHTREAVDFAFNGWGGKYLFAHDPGVAGEVAKLAGVKLRPCDLIAEGGALDTNGAGTFLSTRECLLNGNRNPGMDAAQVESALADALGCRKVIWLERGLVGDHTDGHVDNIARFTSANSVVCSAPSGKDDPNYDRLLEIRAVLESECTADGEALKIITIPSPGRIEGPSGVMAASYCNFLIANRVVIVPTFGVDADADALGQFASLFPDRRIIPHPAYALLTGGGTVHCISQQEPRHD